MCFLFCPLLIFLLIHSSCMSFPGVASTKYHKLGGSKQQKCIVSQSRGWKFEIEMSAELCPL